MNKNLSEKEYQHYIMECFCEGNGFVICKVAHFDSYFAMDQEVLF